MKLDKFVRSVLKTVVYMMEEAADRVDRVSDRASAFAENTRHVLYPDEGHTVRNVVSFAAGVGVGIAAGLLLAPSSGVELRGSIGDKVHNIGDKIRGQRETYATGTDLH